MLAKRFFYVSAALFLLAATYNLGTRSAGAQSGGQAEVPTAKTPYKVVVVGASHDGHWLDAWYEYGLG